MKSIKRYGEMIIQLSEFVRPLDEAVRTEAFKFLLNQELGQIPSETPPTVSATRGEKQTRAVAPQELIRKTKASSFTEKAVILAYWLETYQQKPNFSSIDLKMAFEQAREQSAKNPSDLVAKLEATARIMKSEKVGAVQHYRLTSTAINEIETKINQSEEQ
jgi:hypothetical protein